MADANLREARAHCKRCGNEFSYPVARGTTRAYCGKDCSSAAQRDAYAERMARTECSVAGCDKPMQSFKSGLCTMHLARVRRRGSLDRKQWPTLIDHSAGYKLLLAPHHPISTPGQQSRVYEHRAVFYAHYGEGPFRCHWCSAERNWEDMHVDHLDDDKTNNDISNLVASCPECNQQRGYWKAKRTLRQRRSRKITWQGRTQPLPDWAEELGIPVNALKQRLKAGWTVHRAFTEPRGCFGPRTLGHWEPAKVKQVA